MKSLCRKISSLWAWIKGRDASLPGGLFPWACGVLFVVMVALGTHGTAIGHWDRLLGAKTQNYHYTQVGQTRPIRSDEWRVSLPFVYAQCASKQFFPRVNRRVNNGCDMFVQTPCAPVWDWTALGQFHNWGYFLFGAERGTSWCWWVRYLGIPFFAYLFFLGWCRGSRLLAIAGALACVLGAPCQWWDTTVPYYLLYFFATLVMTRLCIGAKGVWTSVASGIGLAVFLTSYVFVMYPPFGVALMPTLVALMVFSVLDVPKEARKGRNWIVFVLALGVVVCEFCYFLVMHSETLKIIADSSYPGRRLFLGGSFPSMFARSLYDLASAVSWMKEIPGFPNTCEIALYISLTVPILYCLVKMLIERRAGDRWIWVLAVLWLIPVLWECLHWPAWLAKATGLFIISPNRYSVISGIIAIILALRYMAGDDSKKGVLSRNKVVAALAVLLVCLLPRAIEIAYTPKVMACLKGDVGFAALLFIVLAIYVVVSAGLVIRNRKIFAYALILFSLITGAVVHPIAKGLSPLHDHVLLSAVRSIDRQRHGKWWSNSVSVAQAIMAEGLDVYSGVQLCADVPFWKCIDPEGAGKKYWNRYAHRTCSAGKVGISCPQADCVNYSITPEALSKLGVRYIVWFGRPPSIKGYKEPGRCGPDTIYEKEEVSAGRPSFGINPLMQWDGKAQGRPLR